jgi:hypothetical protein
MFTTTATPHKAGRDLPLSNHKASTASELLTLFGARQTPDSVTKSKKSNPLSNAYFGPGKARWLSCKLSVTISNNASIYHSILSIFYRWIARTT